MSPARRSSSTPTTAAFARACSSIAGARALEDGSQRGQLARTPEQERRREARTGRQCRVDVHRPRFQHPAPTATSVSISYPGPTTTPNAALHNIPIQVTSFIGREREIADVKRLLATSHLLTLTGAGGCGKTRLALQVATDAVSAYPDGVWLAELATLTDAGLVPHAVASAVGVREAPGFSVTDTLVDYLRSRTLLLVLDNCEHVVGNAAQLVDALLRSCSGVRILATSREPLASPGETTWRVPSLGVPPQPTAGEFSPEQLGEYEAVRLFIERASAARSSVAVTAWNAPALAEICRRLDGIPLAIELAAARVRVFSLEQIASRLDDRFRLLTSGQRTAMARQQTLQATVDWSYVLLSEPERAVLRRLSVFAGGWTFEAAESVASGDGIHSHAILDVLAQLVDKSLVIADEHHGVARYRLLETIRQYARERLQEARETDRTRDRHLSYFLQLAEESEPELRGPRDRVVLGQFEVEHDNLRVALDWSLSSPSCDDAALRLTGAMAWFWWLRSYYDEALRWLARALAATADRSPARMKALHGAGWLVHHRRDSAGARELLGESLAIARELDDRWTVAFILHHLGRVAYFDKDSTLARSFAEQSLAAAEEIGDRWLIAWPLHLLGLAAYIAGDYPTARAYYERSLAIRTELGYRDGIGMLLLLLGFVAAREGDLSRAVTLYRDGVAVVKEVHGPWSLGMPLAGFAHVSAVQGEPGRSVRLGAAATALSALYGMPLIPLAEALLTEGLELARQELDAGDYAAAWADGRAMSVADALAEAMTIEVPPQVRVTEAHVEGVFGRLTQAEVHVLRLLAAGSTTKEIAGELVVAVSTVDRHITHIYEKLGVRNRAAATALATKHGLS
jgi:predicted ATPase/DNA-binding CsgD family transcriptional regulator